MRPGWDTRGCKHKRQRRAHTQREPGHFTPQPRGWSENGGDPGPAVPPGTRAWGQRRSGRDSPVSQRTTCRAERTGLEESHVIGK